jgi:methylmalonyl-CoA mutase cobalamin-binding domain/chain
LSKEKIIRSIVLAIAEGKEDEIEILVENAITFGIAPFEIINKGGVKGLELVGERFDRLEAFLPELVMAGDTMKRLVDTIIPLVGEKAYNETLLGNIVIATVKKDLHDIGKNLVSTLLKANGFNVLDLGIDVDTKEVIKAANDFNADIIALSSLLSTAAYYQQELIDYLNESGNREKYYVVVGGGAITPDWTRKIGADGYGKSAQDAITLCKKLVARDRAPLKDPLIVE